MNKRYIALGLIGILSISTLYGCGNKGNEGKIDDVQVTEEEPVSEEVQKKNIFTPTKEPFGYDYKTIKNERANMQFSYPSKWDCTIHNARHIELNPDAEDKNFSTLTTHILYRYNMGSEETNSFVANYDQLFKSDLIGLKYRLEGRKDFQEMHYVSASSQETDSSFTSEPDRISMGIRDNVYLADNLGFSAKETYTALYYSVYWDQYPCLLATVCKTSELENAKKMMNHIVSTMKTVDKKTKEIDTTYEYEGMTITLPNSFKQNPDYPNLFSAGTDNLSKYAGMNIGLFEVDGPIDDKMFAYDYAPNIATTFLTHGYGGNDNNMYAPNSPSKPVKLGNKDATEFLNTCLINRDNSDVGDFYKSGDTYFMHNIVIDEGNGKSKVLTIWYLDGQFFTEQDLFKQLKNKIHFDAQ